MSKKPPKKPIAPAAKPPKAPKPPQPHPLDVEIVQCCARQTELAAQVEAKEAELAQPLALLDRLRQARGEALAMYRELMRQRQGDGAPAEVPAAETAPAAAEE